MNYDDIRRKTLQEIIALSTSLLMLDTRNLRRIKWKNLKNIQMTMQNALNQANVEYTYSNRTYISPHDEDGLNDKQ